MRYFVARNYEFLGISLFFELDYSSWQKTESLCGMESTIKVLALGKSAVRVIFQHCSQMTICFQHSPNFERTSLELQSSNNEKI